MRNRVALVIYRPTSTGLRNTALSRLPPANYGSYLHVVREQYKNSALKLTPAETIQKRVVAEIANAIKDSSHRDSAYFLVLRQGAETLSDRHAVADGLCGMWR